MTKYKMFENSKKEFFNLPFSKITNMKNYYSGLKTNVQPVAYVSLLFK